jgi:uncharacterized membrane protein YhaH (DUF805 family)
MALIIAALLWLIAVVAARAVIRMPARALDIYINDRYFPVSKVLLFGLISVVLVMPALALTIRRFRKVRD